MAEEQSSCCLIPSAGCCLGILILFACIALIPVGVIYALGTGGPEPLYDDFEPSRTQADAYEASFNQAIDSIDPDSRTFEITFEDEEFMSWVNLEYQDQIAGDNVPNRFQDNLEFQTRFTEGVIQSFVRFAVWDFLYDLNINTRFDFTLEPAQNQTATDKFDVEVTRIEIGRFEDTSGIESNVDEAITEALSDQLERLGGDYTITSVVINDGSLTITGQFTGDPATISSASQ